MGQSQKAEQDAVSDTEWSLLTIQWPTVKVPDAREFDEPGAAELIQSIRERMDAGAQSEAYC